MKRTRSIDSGVSVVWTAGRPRYIERCVERCRAEVARCWCHPALHVKRLTRPAAPLSTQCHDRPDMLPTRFAIHRPCCLSPDAHRCHCRRCTWREPLAPDPSSGAQASPALPPGACRPDHRTARRGIRSSTVSPRRRRWYPKHSYQSTYRSPLTAAPRCLRHALAAVQLATAAECSPGPIIVSS